jgi:class 3 adenylate cyclase
MSHIVRTGRDGWPAEDLPGTVARPDWVRGPASDSGVAALGPMHRTIVAVDIVASTARTNPARAQMRQAMYSLLDEALTRSGIVERHRDRMVDRGDGALVLVHPVDQLPKTLLISTFVPTLSKLIYEHNEGTGASPLQLRAALHAGEIHYDSRGPFGEALDIACRLVDAPEFRNLTRHILAPLWLVVSDHFFQSVVKHGYSGIDDNSYLPIIRTDVGGCEHRGWLSVA